MRVSETSPTGFWRLGIGSLLMALLLTACVSNRKLLLLQNKSGEASGSLAKPMYAYQIQPGDVLYIEVKSTADLISPIGEVSADESQQIASNQHPFLIGYTVNADGSIDVPIVGNIMAKGLTVEALTKKIRDKAQTIISLPRVKIYLLSFYVKVLGEVNNAGLHPVYYPEPDIFDALSLAGGLTIYADRKAVQVVRKNGDKKEIIYLDITDQAVLANTAAYLKPGDIIVVNPLKQKGLSESNIPLVLSILSSAGLVISVILSISTR